MLAGVPKSAAHQVVDHLAPLLMLAPPARRHCPDTMLIVDGTPVPVHDPTITVSSKNYRYSVNMQVVIDVDTRLVAAAGRLRSRGLLLAMTVAGLHALGLRWMSLWSWWVWSSGSVSRSWRRVVRSW